jgi:tetratricopeptide (TPR) repeat protein
MGCAKLFSMVPESDPLQPVLAAIEKGEENRAREMLAELIRKEPNNPRYYMWMSTLAETKRERVSNLKEALRLDPNNATVRKGLVLMGELQGDTRIAPVPMKDRRDWEKELRREMTAAKPAPTKKKMATPTTRIILAAASLFALIVMAGTLIFWPRNRVASPTGFRIMGATATASPMPATETPRPTRVEYQAPTPTLPAQTPLWMFLESTYTPTPFIAFTEHPQFEAFQLAMTAYANNDWSAAVDYFQQVIDTQQDITIPDILYYQAESYRNLGYTKPALDVYNRIIKSRPEFAPAYMGRGLTRRMVAPKDYTTVVKELNEAIRMDPTLLQAYLEAADTYISVGLDKKAVDYIDQAVTLAPESPRPYYLRSEIALNSGNLEAALADAKKSNQMDITYLPAYRLIGEIYQKMNKPEESISALETYTQYIQSDYRPYIWLGLAYAEKGNYPDAINAFTKALSLEDALYEANLGRAQSYYAVNDLENAKVDYDTAIRIQPKTFDTHSGLAKTLFGLENFADAYNEINIADAYDVTPEQKALVFYWRALALEKLSKPDVAAKDWVALIALPRDAVPPEWLDEAYQHLAAMGVDSATITPGVSRTPTRTSTP